MTKKSFKYCKIVKQYFGHTIYRGRSMDITFCAKAHKEVAEITGCSLYEIQNYYNRIPAKEPFSEMKTTPYGSKSTEVLDINKQYTLQEAKELIDVYLSRKYNATV